MIDNLKGVTGANSTSAKASKIKEKTMEEPRDSAVINSKEETEPVAELSEKEIKALKKDMEKEGFVFDDKGFAPAIIYPSGEAKLIAGQEVVCKYLGEVTATLWQVEAFTANISPEAYHFFSQHESHYTVVPDSEFTYLKKPKMKFGLIALCDSLDNMQ
jgi:hypothetical protein